MSQGFARPMSAGHEPSGFEPDALGRVERPRVRQSGRHRSSVRAVGPVDRGADDQQHGRLVRPVDDFGGFQDHGAELRLCVGLEGPAHLPHSHVEGAAQAAADDVGRDLADGVVVAGRERPDEPFGRGPLGSRRSPWAR